jgi:hypothetical protein
LGQRTKKGLKAGGLAVEWRTATGWGTADGEEKSQKRRQTEDGSGRLPFST